MVESASQDVYIGIDPGVNGGIACLIGDDVYCTGMPRERLAILEWLKRCCDQGVVHATLELVTGYIGGAGNTGSSMFSFGKSVGAIEMALTACGVSEYQEASPSHWQKTLGIEPRRHTSESSVGPSGRSRKVKTFTETPSEFKRRLRETAIAMFPDMAPTMKTADALLIAHYTRLKHRGF